MKKALFLDRDGTLIEDVGYLSDVSQIKLIHPVVKYCKNMENKGYELVVITNQSGVARGYFDEEFVKSTHQVLKEMLMDTGINIKAFYYCPHHPDYGTLCNCRKPKPGMLLQAARDLEIDLKASIMVGDRVSDINAGMAAGCRGLLVQKILEKGME